MANNDFDSMLAQAQDYFNTGALEQADGLCQRLLTMRRNAPRVLLLLGRTKMALYDFAAAEKYLLKCLKLVPKEPAVHLCLAQTRQSQGRFSEAISRYDKVLRLVPDHPVAIISKAEALQWRGEYQKAYDLLQPIIEKGDVSPQMAHVQAGSALRLRRWQEVIDVASESADSVDAPPFTKQHLYLLIGQAYEKLGAINKSFEAFKAGNDAIDVPSNVDDRLESMRRIREFFTPESMSNVPRGSNPTELPVFVVGMPRCGSTLVETIIDAHPRATGLGEMAIVPNLADRLSTEIPSNQPYPACVLDLESADVDRLGVQLLNQLKKHAPRARRVVDKTLRNFEMIGLIELLLPGARIIDCRRDPVDTCFSCFTQPLPLPGHAYACHLEDLGRVYREYVATIEHFKSISRLPILEVQYESLVSEPETQTRRIIDFLGLEWNDRCLSPHETKRQAMTLSDAQVRQPIYQSSVSRAEKFRDHLAPLISALNRDC
ncbi:MAG: sulfotransferase [Planctomycetota bacterium]|nr:sulfotransferase [Planctomycetota bacterium]